MEYCLVEKWNSKYSLPKGCKAIALTPRASFDLEMQGVEYISFDDYFSSGEIRGDTDAYLASQLKWFQVFDKFVQDILPEAKERNIALPSLYFRNIKYLVDNIVLASKVLNKFIDIAAPDKIYFISHVRGEEKFDFWYWFVFGESPFLKLVDPICSKRGVSFERLYSDNEKKSGKRLNYGWNKNKSDINRVKKILKAVKLWYFRYPYSGAMRLSGNRDLNMLVLNERDYIYDFCRDARKNGFNLLFEDKFKKFPDAEIKITIDPELAMKDLSDSDVMVWINEECGVDVPSILYSRFKYLLSELFPETLALIVKFIAFYKSNQIKSVVNYSLAAKEDFAAIAAARVLEGTKSIGFCHGTDAYEAKSRFFGEYSNYDFYLLSTYEEIEQINKLNEQFGDTRTYLDRNHYFHSKFSRFKKKRKQKGGNKKLTVVFAPIMFAERMHMPIDKVQPLQWDFFKWHRALIDYFGEKSDFQFIWKGVKHHFDREKFAQNLLESKGCNNIEFRSERFTEWLPKAHRVICDTPSSAFFECIFSGVPVLSFYNPKDQKLRDNAYGAFGKSLRPCLTVKEKINAIEEFLEGDAEDYLVSLSEKNMSTINIFQEVKNG